MKKDTYFWIYLLLAGIILLLTQSCAPIFSEVQTARMAGKGTLQITPSYSKMSYKESEYKESIQTNVGGQVVYGISENMDFRIRYERLWFSGDEFTNGIDVIGFGPKFGLLEDKMAVNLLVGRALGEYTDETWEAQLSFLGTIPVVEDVVDFTLAPKLVIPLASEAGGLMVAFNFNLAISNDLNKWAIIPEYGFLFSPGNDGHYRQFTIGVVRNF